MFLCVFFFVFFSFVFFSFVFFPFFSFVFFSFVFFSVVSARCQLGHLHLAASDAFELVLDLLPAWPKSYVRLGKACEAMGGYGDAKTWYVSLWWGCGGRFQHGVLFWSFQY